jgi:hypothetical protein
MSKRETFKEREREREGGGGGREYESMYVLIHVSI